MCFMKVHHFLDQLGRLIGREFEVLQVCSSVFLRIVISNFWLYQIRTQKSVRHKGTKQTSSNYIVSDLQAQLITRDILLQLCRVRWIELHLEVKLPRLVWKHVSTLVEMYRRGVNNTGFRGRQREIAVAPVLFTNFAIFLCRSSQLRGSCLSS